MSGERLREAAREARKRGTDVDRAVAAWLVDESWAEETDVGEGVTTGGPRMQALAVADAYLS